MWERSSQHVCTNSHDIWTLVHGDDYVSCGYRKDLAWLEAELKKAYDIKVQHVGPCAAGFSEGKVLNRVVRWQKDGWQVEADPRHGELIIEQLDLPTTS